MTHPGSVSVFGLGYVGTVSAVCLASLGHRVIGIDVSEDKMDLLGSGRSPIIEQQIGELTAEVVGAGNLTVSPDVGHAVRNTDISLICVGTPSDATGGLSTAYLEAVTAQIGEALAEKDTWHVVVYRSTMLPGTCESLLIPMLERLSGKVAGSDFGVCVNPEYLREGTSVQDFFDPAKTVVGSRDSRAADAVLELYRDLPGERFVVPIKVAEMTKYVDNTYHALKVAFANEIGSICSAMDIDSYDVMEIFFSDTKLNIGPAYLKPGFAFGGSCLPKDIRALTHMAQRTAVDTPVLSNLLRSNESHLRRAMDLVVSDGRRKVAIFGLSFKPGTDDLRESPMVELAERLIGKGFDLRIYDPNVALSRVVGANRSYIIQKLPHISELLVDDFEQALEHGEVLIAGAATPEVVAALNGAASDRLIVDLVRLPEATKLRAAGNYRGVAW